MLYLVLSTRTRRWGGIQIYERRSDRAVSREFSDHAKSRVETPCDDLSAATWVELYAISNKLGETRVLSVKESIDELQKTLSPLFSAQRISVVIAGRTQADRQAKSSWKPLWTYNPTEPKLLSRIKPILKKLVVTKYEQGAFQLQGHFRARTLSIEDYQGHVSHKALAKTLGVSHRIVSMIPVTENVEVFLLIDRNKEGDRFNELELQKAVALSRLLQSTAAHWCGLLGILEGNLLSLPEQSVLHYALKGHGEKEIAARLDKSPAYVHQLILGIFRKFHVNSRTELIAYFLNLPKQSPQWQHKTLPWETASKQNSAQTQKRP